jgi:polyphosphate glucokinase
MSKSSTKPSSASKPRAPAGRIRRILAIDIGGTGLKAAVIGRKGEFLSDRLRIKTPHRCGPRLMVATLTRLVAPLGNYDRVSIGFPGYVRGGKVFTAPNLGTKAWAGFDLAWAMAKALHRPVRLNNDADVQGLGVINGNGLELACTLGTGFGTAWFRDGELLPHIELAHMPIHHKSSLDKYIGDRELKKIGEKEWSKRLRKLIPILHTVFNYDRLYLGGGNARLVKFKLPENVVLVSNDAGMKGSAFVWLPKGTK